MDAVSYYNKGIECYKNGQTEVAISNFIEAIKLEYGGQQIPDKMALDEPVNVFRTRMQADMEKAAGHYNLGVIYHIKGYYVNAMQQYQAYLEMHPDNAEVQNLLGMVHVKRKELPKAIKRFEEALRLKPDYQYAQVNLQKAKELKAAAKKPKA